MKKILMFVAIVMMTAPFGASAIVTDSCNQEFVYTKTADFSDSRVLINFETVNSQFNSQIDVSAQSGYEVIKLEMDVDGDGHIGYHTYTQSAVNDYNPNPGLRINSARVTVRYNVCVPPPPVDICPNLEGAQATVPEGYELQNGQCVFPTPVIDVCPNLDGNQAIVPEGMILENGQCVTPTPPIEPPTCSESQHLENNVCVDKEVTPPPAPEPTPISSPSTSGGSRGGHRRCYVDWTNKELVCPVGGLTWFQIWKYVLGN